MQKKPCRKNSPVFRKKFDKRGSFILLLQFDFSNALHNVKAERSVRAEAQIFLLDRRFRHVSHRQPTNRSTAPNA